MASTGTCISNLTDEDYDFDDDRDDDDDNYDKKNFTTTVELLRKASSKVKLRYPDVISRKKFQNHRCEITFGDLLLEKP